MGSAALEVGVPTAPTRAKTRSFSMSRRVLAIASSGSYESSRETSSSPPPVHAARAVAFLEGGPDPEPHASAERFRGARERGGLAEQDAVVADPRNVGGAGRNQGRGGREHHERARPAGSGR